eukprot:IDg22026t1
MPRALYSGASLRGSVGSCDANSDQVLYRAGTVREQNEGGRSNRAGPQGSNADADKVTATLDFWSRGRTRMLRVCLGGLRDVAACAVEQKRSPQCALSAEIAVGAVCMRSEIRSVCELFCTNGAGPESP